MWVARRDEADALASNGYQKSRAVGLPLLYVPAHGLARIPGSLLIMPGHSLVGWKVPDRTAYELYAEEMLEAAKSFEHVTVCINPSCQKNGFWVKEFTQRGFSIISGATTDDANALLRMRMLFEQFESMTTNAWGSHIAYALAGGVRVAIYGTCPSLERSNMMLDTTWRSDPAALDKFLASQTKEDERKFLRAFYVHPSEAVADVTLGEWFLGRDQQLSPKAMRKALSEMMLPLASTRVNAQTQPTQPALVPVSSSEHVGNEASVGLPSVLFLAHGPGQVNGPNIWLTRLLPELKTRGFAPRVLMVMGRDGDCPIAQRLRAAGVPCDVMRYNYTEDSIRQIIGYVRQQGCRIVVPNLNVSGYFAAKHLRAAGIATVGVLHSDDDFYRDLADEFAIGRNGEYLSALVTVSNFQHESLAKLDCGTSRLIKAPYGAPVPSQSALFSDRPFRFLYTGRLVEEQKRISDTVRAMIALLRRQPHAEFLICGDGPARPAVQTLVQESGLGDRIKLFGNVSPDDLQRLLPGCQSLVLLSDYEGIPISLMEAMGAGLVPICTRIRSGVGDIIRDGENGFVVDDRGESFLAAAEALIADRKLWQKCSAAARAVVREKFSTEANAATWTQLLRELDATVPTSASPVCPEDLALPPVRSNPKGMAREDRRRSASAPVATAKPSAPSGPPVGDLPVVLVRSHEYNYSETFVEDHVNYLSSKLTLLYGFPFPRFLRGGESVVPAALEQKLRGVVSGQVKLTPEIWGDYSEAVAEFLAKSGAKAVLVETGLMGAFVHEACERARLPFVVHFHGVDAFGQELLTSWLGRYRKFFQTAAGVVAVSKAMHAQLLKLGAVPERSLLGPYGVAVDLPALADPAKAPPRFAAVGRFVEKKAPHLTLQAFALVHRQVPEARLVMMGDGPLLAACQELAKQHGLADAVTFAGVCSREEVSRQLAASRVFVQHSVTAANGDSEGLPLAVLEAGAHGLPVVSTRHAGIPDAVREGIDGFLVDEKDVAGMTAAMLRLAQDAGEAARLGAAYRARVQEHYSRRRSLERLHGILQAAAERRPLAALGEPLAAPVAPVATMPPVQPAAPALAAEAAPALTGPAAEIAEDRNNHAACLALGRALLKQGKLGEAYVAIAEAHRLDGGSAGTKDLLQQLEDRGALGEPAVETYRRRAGWVPRRKSANPRRILVVTNLLPPQEMGGYGRTVWEFSRELEARGHSVRVLTADLPHLERKPTAEHRAFEANVRRDLLLCGDWQDGKVVVEPDLERRRELIRHNHRAVQQAVKDFEPDAIMAGNLDLMGHFWVQEMLDRGIPVVHRLGNAHPSYEPANAPRSPLFCVAGCSEWVNTNLRGQAYPMERYAVVPPGSPLTEYFRAFAPQWGQLRIAYAGLLMPYKGAHLLVEALAHLHRAGIAFECTLAGDSTSPEYLDRIHAIAAEGGFLDRLRFPGYIGKTELAALFARSNVLVFPSVFAEPFGKTQIEAMAAGMLAISSGSGGAAEIIRHAENGLLFRAGDARDLAEKLAAVHRQPAAAAQLAAAGQASAFRFTTTASVDRLEALFQEFITAARRRSPQPVRATA